MRGSSRPSRASDTGVGARLYQALAVVFTIPGIPLVYAGTEQGFRETRASMFAAGWGIREDPATGSAAAAFAGVVMAFDRPLDGDHMLVIRQGVEMGRPSTIALGLEVEGGALQSATIGGSAVLVAEGTIDL